MSVAYSTLKTQVSQRVGDTSDAMKTIIGTYINQRYKDVLRRTNWNAINNSFEVTSTSGTSDQFLPANFGKELYVYDTVQLKDIPYASLETLEQAYQDQLNDTGNVELYTILDSIDTSATTSARTKAIRFWRTPNASAAFEVPYTIRPADLSSDTDQLVLDCETAVEYGAAADAWLYKRQFAKAQYYEAMYEKAIQTLIWDKTNQPNAMQMMNPMPLDRDMGI